MTPRPLRYVVQKLSTNGIDWQYATSFATNKRATWAISDFRKQNPTRQYRLVDSFAKKVGN